MMKFFKLNSCFLLVALFSIFLFPLLGNEVWAVDLDIDCSGTGTCSKTGVADPLFSTVNDGYWYPGKTLTKVVNLKNSSLETREMTIKGTRTSTVNILENVMHISIVGGTTVIWGGSVADFYNKDRVDMGIFNSGASLDYDFTVSMAIDANDDYQNQETVFDLTLGFWGKPVPTPTPTTTPMPTPTSAPEAVLGTGVSAPACTDTKPGIPTNFMATAGPGAGQVTLLWTPPALPYTYFLIAYSDDSDSPKWGNPNIDAGAVSYTVSGLGGGTYWFWLRAGNGCMPGDFVKSEPVTIGGAPGAGPAPGFLLDILGEKTPGELGEAGATEGAEIGEIKGEKVKSICWWWLILSLLELIILSAYYWFTQKKENIRKYWPIFSFVLAILAFLGDRLIAHRFLTPSQFCSWMWLWVILAAAIPKSVFTLLEKKGGEND